MGWVGAGKGLGSLLDDSCRNPGVRQPWTWRGPRDHRGGTGKRSDRLDGSRGGEGPEERKVAEVSALVPRSWWCDISLGREMMDLIWGMLRVRGIAK